MQARGGQGRSKELKIAGQEFDKRRFEHGIISDADA